MNDSCTTWDKSEHYYIYNAMGMVYQSMRCYTTIALQDYSEVLQWSAYWKCWTKGRGPKPRSSFLIEPRSAFMAITFYVQLDTTPSRSQHPCVHAQPYSFQTDHLSLWLLDARIQPVSKCRLTTLNAVQQREVILGTSIPEAGRSQRRVKVQSTATSPNLHVHVHQ